MHQLILIINNLLTVNPSLWLSAVSQYKVRDTFASYGVMELCTKGLGSSVGLLKQKNVNLACVRTCVVVAEERPRINLTSSFCKLQRHFSPCISVWKCTDLHRII